MRIPTFAQFQQQAGMISKQYDKLSQLQSQASTGKRIINPSDDPALAGQVKVVQDYIDLLQTFDHNSKLAKTRYDLFGSSIQSTIASVTDVQSLIQKARNGTMQDAQSRLNLAKQMEGDLATLLNLANTQDVEGKYIYSGFNTSTAPYSQSGSGFQYNGGYTPTTIDVAPNVSAIFTESGHNIFGNIKTGNGAFTVTAGSGNTGVASTSPGSITGASYVPDTYTIQFVTNAAGELAYQVTGANSGQVIPAPPAVTPANAPVYQPGVSGQDITFNGVNINMNGAAKVGDTFQVKPSAKQDVFTMIQNAITTLKNPVNNQGAYDQALSQLGSSLMQAFNHLVSYQSDFGARVTTINNQADSTSKMITDQTIQKSHLEDADITQVFSQLSQQSLALQVTQQSYLKLQETLSQILKL